MVQVNIEYIGQKEFNKDSAERQKRGWHVVSVSEIKQPVGAARIATIGIGALFIKPKPHFYVTYEKN